MWNTNFPLWQEGSREGILVTAFGANPDGIKFQKAQPVNLRGEKEGDPVNLKNGEFTFDLKAYAPASFENLTVDMQYEHQIFYNSDTRKYSGNQLSGNNLAATNS